MNVDGAVKNWYQIGSNEILKTLTLNFNMKILSL